MRRFVLFLSLLGLLATGSCIAQETPLPPDTPTLSGSHRTGTALRKQKGVPENAIAVLSHIRRTGKPPAGYVGGRTFQNRERNLPRGGRYREYDVNPKIKGKNRGPERLVIDHKSGKAWYTPDHYRTFVLIR